MLSTILATKLYIPPPPPKIVLRPRLIERLNEGLCQEENSGKKLTVISAPAGFGKTTLISEWVASCGRPTAWLSLDEEDKDPARFLAYFITTLQKISSNIGEEVLRALQFPPSPPFERILTILLNEIAGIPNRFNLILDDYHVMDSKPVDDILTFLLERLPPQMHLAITTREDPNLPLARLRARGQLIELRAADLRFTPTEAAKFLNHVMGLNLSAEDVAALESRTEGWIAGLQLAALSMQGSQNIPGFIRTFAGDHRYIVDYLVEEVLRRQPATVRRFLLQTSIIDRLSGSLCDAITGQEEGSARLDALERDNLFVIPLDDQRHWYRYHHLFADFLRMHLKAEQPDQVAALHRRASEWYEHHGSEGDAIRHALMGEDFERAAMLIELAIPEMRKNRQEIAILDWLEALPEELIRIRPVLSVHYAGALLVNGRFEGVEVRLNDAEALMEAAMKSGERLDPSPAGLMVADEQEFHRLPGAIAVYRAALALSAGNLTSAKIYAQKVLDLVPDDDVLLRGSAAGFLGLVDWTYGDLEAAYRAYADCMSSVRKAGYFSDAIGCAIALGEIRITQGLLQEALNIYEQGLQLAKEHGSAGLALRGVADMYVGISEIQRERGDLHAASESLQKSVALVEHAGLPQAPYRWRVAMARLHEAQGDQDGALDLLEEADRLYVGDYFPNVHPVAAWKTRVWIIQGKIRKALAWVRERRLSAEDGLDYLGEFEHITLARLLLGQYQREHVNHYLSDAMRLQDRLLQSAEEGKRTGSIIEILVLRALAHQMRGDIPSALASLERALMLAEPEGYARIFLDEGASMAQLLVEAARRGVLPDYTGTLLAAYEAGDSPSPGGTERLERIGESPLPQISTLHPPVDPLSQRELEVLRLFKTELSGPEIARELVVALSTVRSHTKSIYGKLNVNNRRAAVRLAEELHLL